VIPDESISLSILIVSYNGFSDLRRCVDSVRAHLPAGGWEILVWDNGSQNAHELRALEAPNVKIVLGNENLGFGRANNEIAKLARGEFLLCLNPDTLLKDASLMDLPAHLRMHPECGACGPLLENLDGSLQDGWGERPISGGTSARRITCRADTESAPGAGNGERRRVRGRSGSCPEHASA
jgi:GT2 family glycosyltransferase